ncbi:MAG: photosynthetic reaction center subunit H [Woeseiaceae bacterium]
MSFGLTSNIDLAEILFTLFWVFFIGLIIYLRREDKREGYPLESDRSDAITVQGFPAIPEAKEFLLPHGGTQTAPRAEARGPDPAATPAAPHPGAPLIPTGDPLVDGIGPAAYANRADSPDRTFYGKNRVVPMRLLPDFAVSERDTDPRGMPVVAADGETVGTVSDAWIDRSEPMIYYLEVSRDDGTPNVLVPFAFADLNKQRGRIEVDALYLKQFANAPRLRSPDEITLLEEDKICAYFAGGTLYADDARQEPLL